ncbi:hypothetical protein [Persicobacter diffluens]|uniref:Uncharacterized protein n=1 Tax=Persicobacter diffluens TaxID=981 RepID=A0AAN4VZN8_9BACT|nr:hypothetical protein PEDI_29740 [Persicobacter diffluens]
MPLFEFFNFLRAYALPLIGLLTAGLIFLIIKLQQERQQARQQQKLQQQALNDLRAELQNQHQEASDQKQKEANSRWQKKFNQSKQELEERLAEINRLQSKQTKLQKHIEYLEQQLKQERGED